MVWDSIGGEPKMDEPILAINETNLGTLSFEILDYADRIMEIFSKNRYLYG